jgi:predicted outer membrane protein
MKRFSPDYTLILTYKGSNKSEQLTKSVTSYFDDNGVLVERIIEKDVQSLLNQLAQKSKKDE